MINPSVAVGGQARSGGDDGGWHANDLTAATRGVDPE